MLGFSEILVLAVIAFLVLGPEEFPKSLQKFLRFINSFKDTFTDLKTEIRGIKQETEDVLFDAKKELEDSVKKPIEDISKIVSATDESEDLNKDETDE